MMNDIELNTELEELKTMYLELLDLTDESATEKKRELLELIQNATNKRIKLLRAENYLLPVSKVSKEIVKAINGDEETIELYKKNAITVYASYLADENIKPPECYNIFLDSVQMTVGSLLYAGSKTGTKYITAEQVIRTLNGLNSKDKVTPQAIKEMENIFEMLRVMKVTFLHNGKPLMDGQILPFTKTFYSYNRNGNPIKVYLFDELPLIYLYSQNKKQVRSLPVELMKINGLRTSAQNTALKIWLLQQIESMKPDPKKKNGIHRDTTIKLSTLFEALKYDITFNASSPRADKAKYIKQIKTMLDSWTAQKYIKGYKENIKARSLESITIFLPA